MARKHSASVILCAMAEELDEFFRAVPTTTPTKRKTAPMSLENQLGELNTNIKALTAALLAAGGAAVAAVAAPAPTAAANAKPAADKAPAAAPAPAGASAALDYEKDVKPLALRVAQKVSREKLVEILAALKVANTNLLKPEQWGEFITLANKALAG